jgi:hypothetical protein
MREMRLELTMIGSLAVLLSGISIALFVEPRLPDLFFQICLPVAAGATVFCFLVLRNFGRDYTIVIFVPIAFLTGGAALLYFIAPEMPDIAFQFIVPAAAVVAPLWFFSALLDRG